MKNTLDNEVINQDSSKRDYYKEPLIIPNKTLSLGLLFIIYTLAFMFLFTFVFNVEINFKNWSGQGALAGAMFAIKEFFAARRQNIKFTNSKIEIIENESTIQTIENSSIYKIFFNYSNVYNTENKISISKNLIIISFLLLGVSILYFRGFGVFAMLIISPILGYFIPRFSYDKSGFKVAKYLAICYKKDKKEFINIFIKNDLYFELIQYFKNIKNINIQKNGAVFSVFDNL